MVPEEKSLMVENGTVPTDKQKMLLALPLQRLIRNPSIRVQDGHIAGIYALLPNLRQTDGGAAPAMADGSQPDPEASPEAAGANEGMNTASVDPSTEETDTPTSPITDANNPKLKETVTKFFAAIDRKNWKSALAMMNDNEKKLLIDDKGRLKESSKQRLSQIDQKNPDALMLQDGKLTGITLLLPSN